MIVQRKRGDAARERLKRAALRHFVRHGISGARTREIAKAARMAEGNLYRHYPGKDALAWGLYEELLGALVAELEQSVSALQGARERIDALCRRFRLLFERDPDAYAYIVLAQHPLMARTPKGMRTPTDVVEEVLKAGQKAGEVRGGEADLLASLLVGMVVRVTLLRLHGLLKGDLDRLEREVAGACWRVVCK